MSIDWDKQFSSKAPLSVITHVDNDDKTYIEPMSFYDMVDLHSYWTNCDMSKKMKISFVIMNQDLSVILDKNSVISEKLHEIASDFLSSYPKNIPNLTWSPTSIYDEYGVWHDSFLSKAKSLHLTYEYLCYQQAQLNEPDPLNYCDWINVCKKMNIDSNIINTVFELHDLDKNQTIPAMQIAPIISSFFNNNSHELNTNDLNFNTL